MFYQQLFESPDEVNVNGKNYFYRDKTNDQRSFFIFPSKEIWVSKIGDIHTDMTKYDIKTLTKQGGLDGRVWISANIISFWTNPVVLFKTKFMEYINLLDEKLLLYNINIKTYQFDMYNMWKYTEKKTCDTELMVNYYYDNDNTPTEDYQTFISRLDNCLKQQIALQTAQIDVVKQPTKIKQLGSSMTSWDSDNNIQKRQRNSTSESFYPTIFETPKY